MKIPQVTCPCSWRRTSLSPSETANIATRMGAGAAKPLPAMAPPLPSRQPRLRHGSRLRRIRGGEVRQLAEPAGLGASQRLFESAAVVFRSTPSESLGEPGIRVGLLVVTLRDGVRDPAGAQRGPVAAAGAGLVTGQMIRSRAGPPHRLGRATRTWSTSPTNWAVSASCPGVSRVARLRPRPSQTVWSLVVSPPRDRPSACCRLAWIAESPLCGHQRRAGGLGPRWSRPGRPSPAPQQHRPSVQAGLDACPGAVGLPAREPLVDRLPGPVPAGDIPLQKTPGHMPQIGRRAGGRWDRGPASGRASSVRASWWKRRWAPMPVAAPESPVRSGTAAAG